MWYATIAIVVFGEAVNHYKSNDSFSNDIRGIPAFVSAAGWPLYIAYRIFDDEQN
jgi:hypothetical protein